ncbi:RHOMBOID-like protein 8 [Dioscorea cayenensis subsp. rotundata]|uniref:RHOMBOID-like protein n=1 Tax=Dioscorea cayennensis subsp. rotundata TaxID=55577 RepID=A0AB40CJR0_DIOCR|nr:RHOMBOID-like protein 8 [Dioscorea cayenensis subsp. rotundata]
MGKSSAIDGDHLRFDLADSLRHSGDSTRMPFFGRRRSGNTWVVSLFLVVQLVVFVSTMLINDCPHRSSGDCLLRSLGRFSFQPLHENPLLGPSASTLVKMGAIQRSRVIQLHQRWRLLIFPWLNAGVIHLVLNLLSTLLFGIHLEQEFGPLRTGIIYLLSAFLGSVVSALFVQNAPAVGSSGALFGLLGATLAGLIRNRKIYDNKLIAVVTLASAFMANFFIGLLPYVDNFSNIGGFLTGIFLGYALLYNPQLSQLERQKGIFDYDSKSSVKLKQKLDKPALRIVALLCFIAIFSGVMVVFFYGIDASSYCCFCHYIDCVPTKFWSCNEKATLCQAVVSDRKLTLTCMATAEFRSFPFTNISPTKIKDLCRLICSTT